ncbi:MAG: cation transporter [Betaproteobacteria bacterium]|nr:cation transporter [Betaproteobacteria bacterium]
MVHLKIGGMTRESCALQVKHALERLPGVRSAVVSYPSGRAQIVADVDMPRETVTEAVSELGYRAMFADSRHP